MNIFYLDNNPITSAKMHCDKHVINMIIRYGQMLSTAHRLLDGSQYIEWSANNSRVKRWRLKSHDDVIYKASYVNHPSTKWARESAANYKYLYNMFVNLCDEFTYRYGKVHLAETKLKDLLSHVPKNIKLHTFRQPPQCMPEDTKDICSIKAYRNYYKVYKSSFCTWTKRNIPEFMI
jgi:hypothetical protein